MTTGHAIGAYTGDPIVVLHVWTLQRGDEPLDLVAFPDQARVIGQALLDSADLADDQE